MTFSYPTFSKPFVQVQPFVQTDFFLIGILPFIKFISCGFVRMQNIDFTTRNKDSKTLSTYFAT